MMAGRCTCRAVPATPNVPPGGIYTLPPGARRFRFDDRLAASRVINTTLPTRPDDAEDEHAGRGDPASSWSSAALRSICHQPMWASTPALSSHRTETSMEEPLLAPFGLTRTLLAVGAMPLYPEQGTFRRLATPEAYRRWIAAVDASFAGNAGKELAAVLPAAAHFKRLANAVPGVPVAVVHSRAYGRRWEQMQRDVARDLQAVTTHAMGAARHNIHMTRP
jgi:hypothetical protein